MIEINLLPKEYLKKPLSISLGMTGLYSIVAAGGVILMLIGITLYQKHQVTTLEDNIAKAQQRAAILEKDITLVDALIDVKTKITRRMEAVERLDSHRSTWVRILEDLAGNVPEFVWLGRFHEVASTDTSAQSGKKGTKGKSGQQPPQVASAPTVRKTEVEGYAFTLNALASFMIKMMRSNYFDEVELVSSDEVKFQNQKAYNFVLSGNLHYLSDEHLQSLIARADEKSGFQKRRVSHKSLN